MFPVNSTATITPRIARLCRVLNRGAIRKRIARAGVFNCRKTSGTVLWSAHAFGDAVDLFPQDQTDSEIRRIADAVVRHATKPTIANLGRPVHNIMYVIAGRQRWIRGEGWGPYSGTPHTTHVHAAGSFSTATEPPCAS